MRAQCSVVGSDFSSFLPVGVGLTSYCTQDSGKHSTVMQSAEDCLKDIPAKVQKTYDACIASKAVLYYPSEVTKEDNALKVRAGNALIGFCWLSS